MTVHPGPSAYNKGCRCPADVELNRLRGIQTRNDLRKRGAENPSLIPHGTAGGYSNWGCRCIPCTAANSAKGAERRALRKAGEER